MKKWALKTLLILTTVPSIVWSSDLSLLESARKHYNKGRFQKAIEVYNRIDLGSDYYLDALEEKAQAYGRMEKYAESLAELKSAMAPQFRGLVSARVYLTSVITQLKTCDYVGVLETNKKFKQDFQPRIRDLTEVAKAGDSELRTEALQKVSEGGLSYQSLGPLVRRLPRNTLRDRRLGQVVKRPQQFEKRLQAMAKMELKEIDSVINKLNIAEVEVEHRVNVLVADGDRTKQGSYAKSSDYLVFPESDEVWIDEIGHFQGQVEKCPSLKRRAGL